MPVPGYDPEHGKHPPPEPDPVIIPLALLENNSEIIKQEPTTPIALNNSKTKTKPSVTEISPSKFDKPPIVVSEPAPAPSPVPDTELTRNVFA